LRIARKFPERMDKAKQKKKQEAVLLMLLPSFCKIVAKMPSEEPHLKRFEIVSTTSLIF